MSTRASLRRAARRGRTLAGVLEAALALSVAKILLTVLPFRRIVSMLGTPGDASPLEIADVQAERCRRVRASIWYVCRVAPFDASCLTRSIAAMYMLRRRHVEATLYLGVAHAPSRKLLAHAWVRCGREFVVGGRERATFVEITSFAHRTAPAPST